MAACISLGKIELKYILMVLSANIFLLIGKVAYPMYYSRKKEILKKYWTKEEIDKNSIKNENILLKSFLKYIGFSLFFIGEKIRNKKYFGKEKIEKLIKNSMKNQRLSLNNKKEISRHLLSLKDKVIFCIISFAHLTNEFISISIKTIGTLDNIPIDEEYISIEFITLFLTSFFIFKIRYYNHQYISIALIIILEIFRYIIKLDKLENIEDFIIKAVLQVIRSFLDSIFIGYAKLLMEYKFFSLYKTLYIFGFINGICIIIIYIIATLTPVDPKSMLCSLKYKNNCYFVHFFSIFEEFNFIQFISLIFNMIGVTVNQFLFNYISNDYTICHIFPYYQIYVLYENTYKKKNNSLLIYTVTTGIFEFLITLVFLEIIVLNCCTLNKNIKENIEKRALMDVKFEDVEGIWDIDENYSVNYNYDNDDDEFSESNSKEN